MRNGLTVQELADLANECSVAAVYYRERIAETPQQQELWSRAEERALALKNRILEFLEES